MDNPVFRRAPVEGREPSSPSPVMEASGFVAPSGHRLWYRTRLTRRTKVVAASAFFRPVFKSTVVVAPEDVPKSEVMIAFASVPGALRRSVVVPPRGAAFTVVANMALVSAACLCFYSAFVGFGLPVIVRAQRLMSSDIERPADLLVGLHRLLSQDDFRVRRQENEGHSREAFVAKLHGEVE
jgi:hypothetical protein